MDLGQITPWIIFGVSTLMLWAMFNFFAGEKSRATERLDELRDPTLRNSATNKPGSEKNGAMGMLEKAAPALSKALQPQSELERNNLKRKLANGGFNGPRAAQMFLAAKMIGLTVCLLIGGSIGFFNWGLTNKCMIAVAIATFIGFYGPEIWLYMVRSGRMERLF